MKQWREIHCDCFLKSAEIKRCLSTTHRCKRLPMMHRCRDILVLDTYCYAPLYQPYIYLQHRMKMITFYYFFFICIKYIIYIDFFSKIKSLHSFSYVDCKWCVVQQRFLSGSYFTHSSVVCFYSDFWFGIRTVGVKRFSLWRETKVGETVGLRSHRPMLEIYHTRSAWRCSGPRCFYYLSQKLL